ncbi:NAD-dependent epimerase/dehydratase family protein [Gilvimarinus polysaccharolyticus]|uniref:NAD-dependent epimerase/dehydratase family protein n=1 Tax=Gilvimarinus polysaccharolyticus TaxID=863921 RepID=UPI000673C23C|nr:NAD-dependent epimerase/dehydratase family protein [Gilvimarinus polysaccharolyticus]
MSLDRKVLITGANGFIGRHLRAGLLPEDGYRVIAGVRDPVRDDEVLVSESLSVEQWREQLQSVDTVIHAAARAHILREDQADPSRLYQHINTEMTRSLALAASLAGVRRFIFISTIGVNGAENTTPFSEEDNPSPGDDYSWSKYQAELALWELAKSSAMEVVILRLPLVYGPGVKANFQSMLRWIDSPVPLPLRSVRNKRSLLGVDNLVSFVQVAISHRAAANQLFLLADCDDISTPKLLEALALGLGRRSKLLPCPKGLLIMLAKMLGKGGQAVKLCGSLQIDASKARRCLGWVPPHSINDGLMRTAQAYRDSTERKCPRGSI